MSSQQPRHPDLDAAEHRHALDIIARTEAVQPGETDPTQAGPEDLIVSVRVPVSGASLRHILTQLAD